MGSHRSEGQVLQSADCKLLVQFSSSLKAWDAGVPGPQPFSSGCCHGLTWRRVVQQWGHYPGVSKQHRSPGPRQTHRLRICGIEACPLGLFFVFCFHLFFISWRLTTLQSCSGPLGLNSPPNPQAHENTSPEPELHLCILEKASFPPCLPWKTEGREDIFWSIRSPSLNTKARNISGTLGILCIHIRRVSLCMQWGSE